MDLLIWLVTALWVFLLLVFLIKRGPLRIVRFFMIFYGIGYTLSGITGFFTEEAIWIAIICLLIGIVSFVVFFLAMKWETEMEKRKLKKEIEKRWK